MSKYVLYYCPIDYGRSIVITSAPLEKFATHDVKLVSTKKLENDEFFSAYEKVPPYFAKIKIREYIELLEAFVNRGYSTLKGEKINDLINWSHKLIERVDAYRDKLNHHFILSALARNELVYYNQYGGLCNTSNEKIERQRARLLAAIEKHESFYQKTEDVPNRERGSIPVVSVIISTTQI